MNSELYKRFHDILKNISIEECQLILGLDRNISELIVGAYLSFEIKNFEHLIFLLLIPQEKIDKLIDKLQLVNNFQFNYLTLLNINIRSEMQYNLMILYNDHFK